MARYTIMVTEFVASQVKYEVEALTRAEARELAEDGDTVWETYVKTEGVVCRVVWDD